MFGTHWRLISGYVDKRSLLIVAMNDVLKKGHLSYPLKIHTKTPVDVTSGFYVMRKNYYWADLFRNAILTISVYYPTFHYVRAHCFTFRSRDCRNCFNGLTF